MIERDIKDWNSVSVVSHFKPARSVYLKELLNKQIELSAWEAMATLPDDEPTQNDIRRQIQSARQRRDVLLNYLKDNP